MLKSKNGLHKLYEDDNQLQYVYYYELRRPLLVKLLLFVITGIIDQWLLLHLSTSIRVSVVLFLFLAALSIPIIKEESILIIRNIGIQLTEKTLLGVESKQRFIPSKKLIDLVINEGFKNLQVVHYLSILVKEDHLITLFVRANLRLDDMLRLRKDFRRKVLVED